MWPRQLLVQVISEAAEAAPAVEDGRAVVQQPPAVSAPLEHVNFWRQDELRAGNLEKQVGCEGLGFWLLEAG